LTARESTLQSIDDKADFAPVAREFQRQIGIMGLGFRSKGCSSHGASFFLGAALSASLLLLFASDHLSEGLSSLSRSWGGTGMNQLQVADIAAPTRDQQEVTVTRYIEGKKVYFTFFVYSFCLLNS
jgi:hypothetical protein